MGKKQKLMVLCSVVLFMTSIAGADTYTMIFNTSDNQFDPGVDNQGWWSDGKDSTNTNDNYGIGVDPEGNEVRNYFSFDLSPVDNTVINATLEIRRFNYWSTAESEILGLFNISTDVDTLNNNSGINLSIFDDLGSGNSYGNFEVFSDGQSADILTFELNSAAINDINNAAGNWFSIGGSILSFGSPVVDGTEFLFGSSSGIGTQRLVLEIIPEPCTLSILAFGSIFLIRRR